jgi:hypothetical protein
MTIPAPDPDKSFCWRCHGFKVVDAGGVHIPDRCADRDRCEADAKPPAAMGPAPGLSAPDGK